MKKTHNTSGTKEVLMAFSTATTITVLTAIPQGCSPKLYPQKTENTERIITVTETVRDTVIQVQPDSSIVEALIRCDSTGRARLEEIRTLRQSARVRQTLALKDNRLTTKTVVDSMGIYLTYKDRYKEDVKVRTIETVIEKEVNILHWWQKALMWTGALSCLAIVIMLLLKLSKRH
ncbi:MAG: hypothetical protein Q4B16_02495 [Bacteroidia bacterium]|nr:hypothetical protein [Bacteroidia bacterium]